MTSLLSFIEGLGGVPGPPPRVSLGVPLILMSATSHLDTSDLVQLEHKHRSLMRQGLAGRTWRVSPPRTAAHPSITCWTSASGKGSEFTLPQEVRSPPPVKLNTGLVYHVPQPKNYSP